MSAPDRSLTVMSWSVGTAPRTILENGLVLAETSRMTVPCRALIIDDDPDMAFLTASTIELANHGLSVVGVAASGEEALHMLPEVEADVVVLDFRMPGRNGLQVAGDILSANPNQSIVLFSAYLDADTVAEADRIGVQACLSKSALRELPDLVRKYCPAA